MDQVLDGYLMCELFFVQAMFRFYFIVYVRVVMLRLQVKIGTLICTYLCSFLLAPWFEFDSIVYIRVV